MLSAISFSVFGRNFSTHEYVDSILITPKISNKAIVNPGKGWILYGKATEQPTELLKYASLGYTRYQWSELEPSEGNFNWKIIDNDLNAWKKAGKKFAFGVMCASTHSKTFFVTPKWVFDAGAKYKTFDISEVKNSALGTPGLKLIPVFDDSVYMAKISGFIRALAARYDGNPQIEFIDVRSYGNWGEGHMYPTGIPEITPEKYKEHLQIHKNAFQKTLLQIATENQNYSDVFEWAVSEGIGLRCDGICANRNGSTIEICNDRIPAVFELYGKVDLLKKLGWWYGRKDKWGRGFRLDECVEVGKPTFCDLSRGGESGLELLKSEPELVAKLNNRLGYHFVLNAAKCPRFIASGKVSTISMKWKNLGVAKIFFPVKIKFALISKNGKIIQTCDAVNSIPMNWSSDCEIEVSERLMFCNIKPGKYYLSVGMTEMGNDSKPTIKLGVELNEKNGWYELCKVTVN